MHVYRRCTFHCILVCFLICPTLVAAATRTWDAGGSDTNWSTSENWSDDTAPGVSDTALFDGTGQTDVSIDTSFGGTVHSIQTTNAFTGSIILHRNVTINSDLLLSGGTLDMRGSGYVLTVKGSWINTGSTLYSGSGTILLTGTGSSHLLQEENTLNNVLVNDGLVLYLPLQEGTGSLVTTNASGYLHAVSLYNMEAGLNWSVNAPTLNFINDSSLDFDGSNDFINVNLASTISSDAFTGCIWIYAEAVNEKDGVFNGGAGGALYNYMLWINPGGSFNFGIYNASGGFNEYTSANTYPLNTWHHVCQVLRSADTSQLYVDGALDSEQSIGALRSIGWFNIGRHPGNNIDYFDGQLDEVRFYNRALSSDEIALLAAGSQPQTSEGTYSLGSDLDIDGNLTLATGTLDVSSENYSITSSGSWFNYGGVFTARSGMVTMDGIDNAIQGGSDSFYTLNIQPSSSTAVQGDFSVSSSLSVSAGATLSFSSFDITATTATISNSGTLSESTGSILHPSSLSVSSSLDIGGTISITLTDGDENIDGTTQDSVTISVDREVVTLTETTANSGIFAGSILTAFADETDHNSVIENNDRCGFYVTSTFVDDQDSTDTSSSQTEVTNSAVACESASGGGGGSTRSNSSTSIPQTRFAQQNTTTPTPTPEQHSESQATVPSASDTSMFFRDVPSSDWFTSAVQRLASSSIISGYKDVHGNPLHLFKPHNTVTYAEALKMILGVSDKQVPLHAAAADTRVASHWAAPYVSYAEKLSLSIIPDAQMMDLPITRGEILQLLTEAFNLSSNGTHTVYFDVPSTHAHAAAIATATKLGWVQGDTDQHGNTLYRFRPDATINRAEMSVILDRILEWNSLYE